MQAPSVDVANMDFDYVIVGAGPAGLAAAHFLTYGGARVAIFEMRARPERVFGSYPVVLNARGQQTLQQINFEVHSRARTTGLDVKELHIVPENRTVAQVPTFGTCIMRDQMAKILLDSAEDKKSIKFFWDHKLVNIDFETHACTFVSTKDGARVVISAARLVAADGARSRVRRACEAAVSGFSAEVDDWGFQLRFMTGQGVEGQTAVSNFNHYVLGDRGYVCQQPNGVWNFSLTVYPETDEDFLTGEMATKERMQRLRSYIEEHARVFADNLVDEDALRSFYAQPCFKGVTVKCSCLNPAGWVCLIGDAAHAVQPATGEGINSGLEDAAVLGRMVREHPDDPFAAFDAQHRANHHALHMLAMQAKAKVVGLTPRERATNIMTTIGLGIGKKMGIVRGTPADFMLGRMAEDVGVMSYADLVEMDMRQTRWLKPMARGIAKVFRVPKTQPEHPARKAETSEPAGVEQEVKVEKLLRDHLWDPVSPHVSPHVSPREALLDSPQATVGGEPAGVEQEIKVEKLLRDPLWDPVSPHVSPHVSPREALPDSPQATVGGA